MRLQPPKQDEHAMEDTEFRLALMMRLRQPVLAEAMPCMHCTDRRDHSVPAKLTFTGAMPSTALPEATQYGDAVPLPERWRA